jgi:hypothetical protein
MQRWEYMELSCRQDSKGAWFWSDTGDSCARLTYVQRLNAAGNEGWELVTVVVYGAAWTYVFKRSLQLGA